MTKRSKRVDSNQKQVVKELRDLGFSVELTYMIGKGFPDFIIGFGELINIPVELKSKGGTLTPDEIKFQERYKGFIITAYNTEEILLEIHNYIERLARNVNRYG